MQVQIKEIKHLILDKRYDQIPGEGYDLIDSLIAARDYARQWICYVDMEHDGKTYRITGAESHNDLVKML